MVANFDLNYLSYFFLMNFKNSCAHLAAPEFFQTTPTFAIRMSRSQRNNRNKVGTQL